MKTDRTSISDNAVITIDVYKEYGDDNFIRTDKVKVKDFSDYIKNIVTKGNYKFISESVETIIDDIFSKNMNKQHRWKCNGYIYIFHK